MPRPKKLREPGDTQVRKVWNKKKTRKYTIAITLDEKKPKRGKKAATKPAAKKSPAKKPRKAGKAGSKSRAKRGSR
ncbi:MAG: hypothetical protein JNJ46_32505 [Myxococcales bacterium]|nr:hypothetical protein [Myxococcales bacterium]